MHGQYRRLTEQSPVYTKQTFGWPKAANLPGATEGLVVAAQDQALRTRYYEHHMHPALRCQSHLPRVQCRPGDSRPHCGRL